MKKLNSINKVSFKEEALYLEDIPINVGVNIESWLKEFCNISYKFENYSKSYSELQRVIFEDSPYIVIYLENKNVERICIFPRVWENDSRCYQGDIFILDERLEVPFLSDNIEKYFPNIQIKSKGYWDRFIAHESIDYLINNDMKIEISMSRVPSLVGSLCLKKNEK
ncbi:hypothetical protein [Flavobacterium davisii]|uniref:hypothetical protein n=1 Tax=Flavobacterium davisii TaxID=2906077 RepID=UPI0035CF35DD